MREGYHCDKWEEIPAESVRLFRGNYSRPMGVNLWEVSSYTLIEIDQRSSRFSSRGSTEWGTARDVVGSSPRSVMSSPNT